MSKYTFGIAIIAVVAAGSAGYFLFRPGHSGNGASSAETGRFRECAVESGINWQMRFLPAEQGAHFKINLYDHGCGVAVGDYDGDGHDDVYFVNQLGANALFRNKGDGTFEDVTEKAGVALGDRICVAATFGDTTNSGRQDLYVTSTRGGNVFFRNLGNGKFKDATKEAGLTLVSHSQTAVFFDFDNDGFLDLFVTNTAKWTLNDYEKSSHHFAGPADFWNLAASPIEHNVLYRNNGDGTFTDVTEKAGLKGKGWGGDVAVFDYDRDGHLDLLVTNMFGASQLYRNKGDGTFTEVTHETLGRTSWGAIGAKAFDFNNDGRLDLFISDMHSDMWLPFSLDPRQLPGDSARKEFPHVQGYRYEIEPAGGRKLEKEFADKFKIHYDEVLFGNTLFKCLPSGNFAEVSYMAGMETFWPWGIATGDFDNNGYEDVFLPAGMGYPYYYWPNSLMMNNGNETFTDKADRLGIEPPPGGESQDELIGGKPASRSSRCAAVADFDGDGRLDLIVNNFNDRPFYFRNQLPKRNFVSFRLRGTKSNRDAIGAVVRVHQGGMIMTRQVQAAGGYLSQSSKTVHFGLGDNPAIAGVEIAWPSGTRQHFDKVEINKLHDIVEP